MLPDTLVPTLIDIYLIVYAMVTVALFFYGIHAYVMAGLFVRVRRQAPSAAALTSGTTRLVDTEAQLPTVTIQLPIYNELYVVDRLIDAACAMDYPRDRLEIQVLDDSTDETSARVAQLCKVHRARGLKIEHVQRTIRPGFKGGALREGLETARGEYVAVFDADFVPPPGFLRTTTPYFADDTIGMVQARWGHLNEDYSALTRVQSVALDGHFIIEQTVRNRVGACINFNGTAGIWRKQCIIDAGNWQDDTLTEDLDLSYRAQLRGWRFIFLPDLVCPAELPVEVNAFKGQQFRWAKGSMQTAKKLMPTLLRSSLNLFAKGQAVVHLTNHLVYPLLLLLALLTLPSLIILENHPETASVFRAMTVLVIASFGHPVLYALSQTEARSRWWSRLHVVPMIIAGGMGIAVNNTRALVEAMLGRHTPFIRTPKYRLVERTDDWARKRYRAPRDWTAYIEVGMALYIAITVVYAVATGRYLILPFLALYLVGFIYIGGLSLLHGRRQKLQPAPALDETPARAEEYQLAEV